MSCFRTAYAELSSVACTLLSMPNRDAKFGDAYWVTADATAHPTRVGRQARPMACVAELPNDTAWRGLPRVSSDVKPGDVPSRPMPEIHATRLDRPGWWTPRYIHPVRKSETGIAHRCEYLGHLPRDEEQAARTAYRNRPLGT